MDCDIPVSYHLNKDEGGLILRGVAHLFVNDDGSVAREDYLASFNDLTNDHKNKRCYARINRFVFIKLNRFGGILMYEATMGPFDRNDTVYKDNF